MILKCTTCVNTDILTMDTIPEQCMKENIALGDPQCMDQARRWPDGIDCLGNEQP